MIFFNKEKQDKLMSEVAKTKRCAELELNRDLSSEDRAWEEGIVYACDRIINLNTTL